MRSSLWVKSALLTHFYDFRSTPINRHCYCPSACLKRARLGHRQSIRSFRWAALGHLGPAASRLPIVRQILVDKCDCHASLTDGRSNSLHRTRPHVATGENTSPRVSGRWGSRPCDQRPAFFISSPVRTYPRHCAPRARVRKWLNQLAACLRAKFSASRTVTVSRSANGPQWHF